ncbi:hypothetical protein ISCGN_017201 [Ixodes scapularis]
MDSFLTRILNSMSCCSKSVPESVCEDADASYISFTAGDLYDEGSPRSQERRGPVRPRAVAPPKPLRHFHYQQHHNPGQRSNTGFPSNWNASRDPFSRRHLAAQSASRTRSDADRACPEERARTFFHEGAEARRGLRKSSTRPPTPFNASQKEREQVCYQRRPYREFQV